MDTRTAPVATAPFPLEPATQHSMAAHARGAVVRVRGDQVVATWLPNLPAQRLAPGQILLAWTLSTQGTTQVTATLGLTGCEVLLATWPSLPQHWLPTVLPTVREVGGLHQALQGATAILEALLDT